MQKHGLVTMTKRNIIYSPHDIRGFTLLETMIAMVLLTIGILVMMTMQTSAITGNYRASTMTIASNIASRQIETLRNAPFVSGYAGNTYTATDPLTGYDIEWEVTQVPGTPIIPTNKAQTIKVTVKRPNGMNPVIYYYTKFKDL